jgi:hypothetical protein
MMVYMDRRIRDIVNMPRGGPDASWLDWRLQTNRLEYLDRDDVDELKRKVVRSLDRGGRRRWFGIHERCARIALGEVADVPSPKILGGVVCRRRPACRRVPLHGPPGWPALPALGLLTTTLQI